MKNKLQTISNLFEGSEIRSVWDSDKEDYYFSVVDVIHALAKPKDASDYWTTLKRRLIKDEGSELPTNCRRLKMRAKDGKQRPTDTLDTEGIFRLIESIPSKKAEPFKLWLAKLGRQEIDNIFDPSKGIAKMIDYYLNKGYDLEWIEQRIKAIVTRKKLTNEWRSHGIFKDHEYAILTNEIYKTWSGMTASEYKNFKGITKESLRDSMNDIEVILTDLGETTTKDIIIEENPQGLKENIKVAQKGGNVANDAKKSYEQATKKSAISKKNYLSHKDGNYLSEKFKKYTGETPSKELDWGDYGGKEIW